MIVKPEMGLVVWTAVNDYFSHVQLAANFEALDAHNHTPGKGAKIGAGGIAEQAVEYSNLSAGAVESLVTATKSGLALPVNKTLWQEAAVTRTSTSYGSFSTPIKLELGKVKANQLIELKGFGYAKNTIESSSTSIGGFLNVILSSASHVIEVPMSLFLINSSAALAANTIVPFVFNNVSPTQIMSKLSEASATRGVFSPAFTTQAGLVWPFAEEVVTMEIQGKSSSGTLTSEKVFVNARVY
jgi:hypothetical protein